MIKLLRVDYRLVHGQVAISWSRHIGADCILVAVQEYERIIEDFKQKAPDYMEIIPLARKFEGIK